MKSFTIFIIVESEIYTQRKELRQQQVALLIAMLSRKSVHTYVRVTNFLNIIYAI